ncbi:calmodulin-lysine N-methyltransferase isoform X3 [Oryzias latipes]
MERNCTTAEKRKPASPLRRKSTNADTCSARAETCDANDVARARWTLLRQVLRQKQLESPEIQQVSVRRFATFDLFSRELLEAKDVCDTSDAQWVEYRSVHFPEYSALLRDNLGPVRVNEVLNSFDNTGNICVWPSEEVMAHYCLQKRHTFKVLRWDCEKDISAFEDHFDVIMCADCLFLDQYRASLVDAIRRLMHPKGMALVFAPRRSETLSLFCELAQQAGLCVSQHQQYDAQVWDVHLKMQREGKQVYDENIHYPLLIILTKGPQPFSHSQ